MPHMVLGETSEEKKQRVDPDGFLDEVMKWKQESEDDLSTYHARWAKNLQLLKGVWDEEELTKSNVRRRSKIFFRKIWATTWRLLASMYNAFLRDPEIVKIEGRGPEDVKDKAEILQIIADYRNDKLKNEQSLFLQHLWGLQNIINLGWAAAKFCWEYDGIAKDGPRFTLYPNDQVFPDMKADLKENMRYCILESYLTMDEMEELGYENLDDAVPTSMPSNPVRTARYLNHSDPLQNPMPNEYPTRGRYVEPSKESRTLARYKVWEIFFKEDGQIKMAVTNGPECVLKKKKKSPYGDKYPLVLGQCLTEAHKLVGEGFPEPLEGPQKSYNHLLNARKDNIHLFMNRGTIVDRYANVDLQSLLNSRPGGATLADRVDAVKEREMGDITQSAYVEARQDAAMMEELSGITPGKLGFGNESKTGVAQINQEESDAKIDLFIAVIANTWFKDFYNQLVYMIQRFETDENVFRVANRTFRNKKKERMMLPSSYFIDEIDDFEADIIVNVGPGTVGRERDIRQTMLFMDRAIMSNQASATILTTGAVPPQGLRFFDTTKIMEAMLPKIGYRNVDDYFFMVPPPPPPDENAGKITAGDAAAAGALQPQVGSRPTLPTNSANLLQKGSAGGGT